MSSSIIKRSMDSSIRLLFFSTLRDILGSDEVEYAIPEAGITVGELLDQLFEKHEGLAVWQDKLLIAVNCEYAKPDAEVSPGDEVAVMPPVQGG